MRWLDGITDAVDMDQSKCPEVAEERQAWYTAVQGVAKVRHCLLTEHTQTTALNAETQVKWDWNI